MTGQSATFSQAIQWRQTEPGLLVGSVPAHWAQGRAAFGGLLGAIALRAMRLEVESSRQPRALTVTFAAPLPPDASEAQCRTRVLRSGKALTILEARIEHDAAPCCVAQGVFGEARASVVQVAAKRPPEMPAIEQSLRFQFVEGVMPAFLRHVRMHWAFGNLPSSGAAVSAIGGYCELIDDEPLDACGVVALLDAWPSPAFAPLSPPYRASTASWTVDFVADFSAGAPRGPFRYACEVVAAGGGHVHEEAWLWDAAGDPLARAVQLLALFG